MSGGSRCLLCPRPWRTAGTQSLIDLHGAPCCFRVISHGCACGAITAGGAHEDQASQPNNRRRRSGTGLASPRWCSGKRMAGASLRLIVPWPPAAVRTRSHAPSSLSWKFLGHSVLIENLPGSSGAAGAQEVARAAPDGSTWLLAFDTEATNQTTMRLPYRTLEAFAPVTLVATGPLVFVADQFAPYATYADVLRAARRNPMRCATPRAGSAGWRTLPPRCCSRRAGKNGACALPGWRPCSASRGGRARAAAHVQRRCSPRAYPLGSAAAARGDDAEETRHVPGHAPLRSRGQVTSRHLHGGHCWELPARPSHSCTG